MLENLPAAQAAQAPAVADWPGLQTRAQLVAPAVAWVGHAAQAEAPAAAAKVPAAHEVHLDALDAEYDPARQLVQATALALAEWVPAAQPTQLVDPWAPA